MDIRCDTDMVYPIVKIFIHLYETEDGLYTLSATVAADVCILP